LLYSEFNKNVYDKYLNISSRYKEGYIYKKEDIKVDLASLLKLNETLNDHHISQDQKNRISGYLDIIDPDRNVFPEKMEIYDLGWGGPNVQSLIAKYDGKVKGKVKAGNPAKYKSTGQVVYIMYQNKKYKRVIYVKDKRNTRYCKINKEYILLSKLKVIQ
jgi:hypothetical protein